MKYINKFIWIALLGFYFPSHAQFYNDGADVIVQDDALLHIQGDFINQGGLITNQGLIELGGDWLNTISDNPLMPGSGVVSLLGNFQTIGGGFNTLFYDLLLSDDQEVSLANSIGVQNVIDLSDGFLRLNGNILHLLSPSNTALSTNTGGIFAELSGGFVRWDIGEMGMGNYSIPFQNGFNNNVHLDFGVTSSGAGADGYLLATTSRTNSANSPLPSSISNRIIEGDDTGLNLVDRFWQLDAIDFTTQPGLSASLTYDTQSEILTPNTIDVERLELIVWDSVQNTWGQNTFSSFIDENVVTSPLDQFGYFMLWSNTTTSVIDAEKLVSLSVFPNPTTDLVQLTFDSPYSESARILVVNTQGQYLRERIVALDAGQNRFRLHVEDLPDGMYQLLIVGESIQGSESLIIHNN